MACLSCFLDRTADRVPAAQNATESHATGCVSRSGPSPTLFCFIVARTSEFHLVQLHVPQLLQCTANAVYSNVTHPLWSRCVLNASDPRLNGRAT